MVDSGQHRVLCIEGKEMKEAKPVIEGINAYIRIVVMIVGFAAIIFGACTISGCAMLVGGIVGAAVTPIVLPATDRVLDKLGLDWVDPAGTSAVK
jgi:hypothetical protein